MADGATERDDPLGYVLLHRFQEGRSLLLPGARRVGEALAEKATRHAVEAQTRLQAPLEAYRHIGNYSGEKLFTYLYRLDVPYSEIQWMGGAVNETFEPRYLKSQEFFEAVTNGLIQTNHLELLVDSGLLQPQQAAAA